MNTSKAIVAGLLALGCALPVAAEIRLGASVSATGPAGILGDPEARTLELLVQELNARGGIKGEKIKLVLYDDGGDANKARTFATRLVEDDEVQAIIGGTTTGTSMSILSVAEDAKVPFISLAGAIDIIDPVKPYTFKTPHTDRMACQKVFADMRKNGWTKVALIGSTDGFGASMQAQCKAVAGQYGIELVGSETYEPKDADMTAQLTKIRGIPGVQAVLNPGFGQSAAVLARNYRQLGMNLPFYASHGVASQGYIDLAGADVVEGFRLPGTALLVADLLPASDPQAAPSIAYKKAFEARTGAPVGTFGGYAHDAFLILVDALNRAGSTKPAAIRNAIEKTSKLAGTTGVYTFSPTDHLGLDLSAFRVLEIRGGKWKVVD
ncbi:ABC transporter substrate-binding protein [Bordetella genomosp. 6]|uniref:ABC transporter substrate-binding protein n=1 Tax=Bordetella genomosp. 6 TaxID=463024 RepID=UPI000A2976CF|nr:ABC transporter substrate-binding protein [Bordetella genomosp. 6]ARP76215.1 ABC transporter substrate-binding protein [Bordetella genomosp. 6]